MTDEECAAAMRRWPRVLALALTGGDRPTVTWREFCEAQDAYAAALRAVESGDYTK